MRPCRQVEWAEYPRGTNPAAEQNHSIKRYNSYSKTWAHRIGPKCQIFTRACPPGREIETGRYGRGVTPSRILTRLSARKSEIAVHSDLVQSQIYDLIYWARSQNPHGTSLDWFVCLCLSQPNGRLGRLIQFALVRAAVRGFSNPHPRWSRVSLRRIRITFAIVSSPNVV